LPNEIDLTGYVFKLDEAELSFILAVMLQLTAADSYATVTAFDFH
jgi:hypothetical protein